MVLNKRRRLANLTNALLSTWILQNNSSFANVLSATTSHGKNGDGIIPSLEEEHRIRELISESMTKDTQAERSLDTEILAYYNPSYGCPLCKFVGPSCSSGTLLTGVGTRVRGGPESNAPNTVDKCEDVSIAIHGEGETVNEIRVRSLDGENMQAGKMVRVEATVFTAKNITKRIYTPIADDVAHIFYSSTGVWKYLTSKILEPGQGSVVISADFEVPETASTVFVRVNYGYGKYKIGPCTPKNGGFTDVDDMGFVVEPKNDSAPTLPPVTKPVDRLPQMASYNADYTAPACMHIGSSCDTGPDLISGVGLELNGGPEVNAPNTIDDCVDKSVAKYPYGEYIDRIKVQSLEGEILTVGKKAEIQATLQTANTDKNRPPWFGLYNTDDVAHFFYKSDLDLTWTYISSKLLKVGSGRSVVTAEFVIPEGRMIAVRVNYGYNEYIISACEGYDGYRDVDDLVFGVAQVPNIAAADPTNTSLAIYDETKGAPRCSSHGPLCDSNHLLLGVGSTALGGPEPNAPNSIDLCQGEETSTIQPRSRFHADESVDQIIVRSVSGETMHHGSEVEVEVKLHSALSTALRTVENKDSVAHVYYASNTEVAKQDIKWNFLWSELVVPGVGESTFKVKFFLASEDGGGDGDGNVVPSSAQAIRVSYGYNQYTPSACVSNNEDVEYVDVDDLVFEVAPKPVVEVTPPTDDPNNINGAWERHAWSVGFVFLQILMILV